MAFFDASGRVDFETLTQCIQAVVHLRECGFGKLHRVDNVVLAANLFHRLTDQKFIGDLVDADNLCLHLAFRIDVLMKIFIG